MGHTVVLALRGAGENFRGWGSYFWWRIYWGNSRSRKLFLWANSRALKLSFSRRFLGVGPILGGTFLRGRGLFWWENSGEWRILQCNVTSPPIARGKGYVRLVHASMARALVSVVTMEAGSAFM